jgi:hypothetical protein
VGDTITARVTVTAINAEKNRVTLKTTCSNQEGTVVLEGEAIVSPPKAPKKLSARFAPLVKHKNPRGRTHTVKGGSGPWGLVRLTICRCCS